MHWSRDQMLRVGWNVAAFAAVGIRLWNAIFGPLLYGYDQWAHLAYIFFIDMYHALPYADQGWSYFHPPFHYLLGWVVMQVGDPKVLMVGVALIGSMGSLAIAWLGAKLVRWSFPGTVGDGLALLAFAVLAFLPVHLYVSPMPGNEMTAAFLGSAAVVSHLRNDLRGEPTRAGDVLTGLLCGLALLTKFTALIPCLAIGAWTAIRWLRSGATVQGFSRLALRALAIVVPLMLVAGPWYARNIMAFGTPILTSEATSDVARVQSGQFPGERGVLDYVQISPKVFEDSRHSAPHMVHSVWASTYLNIWFDTYREGQLPLPKPPTSSALVHRLTILFGMLGLVPTLFGMGGAMIAARTAWRDRDAVVPLAMLVLSVASVAAFVAFTLRVPTWAALKASYLLNLSLPFGYFIALSTAELGRWNKKAGMIAPISVAIVSLASAFTFTAGAALPRHDDSNQHVSVYAHFGRFQPTRDRYLRTHPNRSSLEARAAAEMIDGAPGLAMKFYQLASTMPADNPGDAPYATNRLAVATALAREFKRAERILDRAIEEYSIPELRVNRGALHLFAGNLPSAIADLRAAIEIDDSLPAAWRSLSVALWLSGEHGEAAKAKARAEVEESTPPRGFPYGIGTGNIIDAGAGQHWMLVVDLGERVVPDDEIEFKLYFPARARNRSNSETRRHKLVAKLLAPTD